MIVADTSAIVDALVGRPVQPALVARLGQDPDISAPHLIDVEFLHVLRRMVRASALSQARADDARTDFDDLAIVRYPHQPLADRIWQLRDTVSAYGAAFLSLAEALGVPLITCDARMARSIGHRAVIELFGTT